MSVDCIGLSALGALADCSAGLFVIDDFEAEV